MTVADFQKIDVHFSESQFLATSNYMIKQLLYSVSMNQLENVDYFIQDSVYQKFQNKIEDVKKNNARLVYDQVSVQCEIDSIQKILSTYQITVKAYCKYCKYFTSIDGKVIGGSPNNRISVIHRVTFQKNMVAENQLDRRCLGCGASYRVLESGKCPNCGRVYDLEKYDYVIVNFE